jgi:hypothetical protein
VRHQQVTIGSLDGIDIDLLASFLEQAFDVSATIGNWENGIPEGMIVLDQRTQENP